MNRIARLALTLGFLAAAVVPVVAPSPAAAQAGMMDGKSIQTGIEAMLAHRQQMKLTSKQVAELEQLVKDSREKHAPLQRELQTRLREQPAATEDPAELRDRPDLRPLFEMMRATNRETLGRLRAILTDEQFDLGSEHLRNSRDGDRNRSPRTPI